MTFSPDATHPLYDEFASSWELMRDAVEGEDKIKAKGTAYLPMKSGMVAISDAAIQKASYEAYKLRAEFPEIVAPTIRGAVGTMLEKQAIYELPTALEPLRERATRDGLSLDELHRRIALELMTVGRYGILPGIAPDGSPYFAGYVAESIRNWDTDAGQQPDWLMLDEGGKVLDRSTGEWSDVERYRECYIENGQFVSRLWVNGEGGWSFDDPVPAEKPIRNGKKPPVDFLPFVFIDTNDLTPDPDDVPLYGLAKLAVRVYRLDADYTFALHMTSEPTPWVSGDFDEKNERKKPPRTIGASRLWVLPENAQAGYLEFSGPGLDAQEKAIDKALQRAVVFGAQIFSDNQRTAESGEAIRLRLGNQHSTLKTIAMNSAAGLERGLKNIGIWLGLSDSEVDKIKVTPNLDFADHTLAAQDIMALVSAWQANAYSKRTLFWNLQRGGRVPDGKAYETEQEEIAEDQPALSIPGGE